MRLVDNPRLKSRPSASSPELLAVAKAVYDSVMKQLPVHVDKHLQPQLKDLRDGVSIIIGKALEAEFDRRTAALVKSYEDRLEQMQKSHQAALTGINNLLKSLPIPQVHLSVPEDAIKIEQLASVVNLPAEAIRIEVDQKPSVVNLPAEAIRIEVEQKPSVVNNQINVPEQATPIVNLPEQFLKLDMAAPVVNNQINVPKQIAPTIEVNVPKQIAEVRWPEKALKVNVESKAIVKLPRRKTVTKRDVEYDQTTGRPKSLIDVTTETEDEE